ncbi:formin-like protein 3 [Cucurbita pepo subsp. pepo]|uniref:formin-like protein 3 n=1 Tax=Cucurbita pepo subsp. pepo TaxID=3664 RepID=UPI000C9D6452|nr:formin-like protein 3 [Cucurbita pepo subsp. pepo]
MELRRGGYVGGLVILLCALAIVSSEGRRKTLEMVIANAADCHFTSSELEGAMGEKACTKQFVPCIQKETMDKSIAILPPEMKHGLLDCLRKRSMFSRDLSDSVRRSIEFIFVESNIHMRQLIRLFQGSSPPHPTAAPAPSPVAESPANSPLLSPIHAPMSSPSNAPTNSPPVVAPAPLPELLPPVGDTDVLDSPPSTVAGSPPLPRASPKSRPLKKHEESQMGIIAGIVAAGVGVVLVVALVLFCCRRGKGSKVEPKDGQKNEKPLNNISLSELPAGSSLKAYSVGNPAAKEFNANNGTKPPPSFVGNLAVDPENHTYMAEGPTSDGKSSAMPPLKPPPGRPDAQPPPPTAPAVAPPPPPPAPRAPPPSPPKVSRPPPAPPAAIPGKPQAPPMAPRKGGPSGSSMDPDAVGHKTKLKPFFWDKVLANPGHSMVWHEISDGSFQFNEEMMESLFGYAAVEANKGNRKKDLASEPSVQYIQIIDPRKAQNLSILLRALNVTTEEVVDAIQQGNPDLPAELMQTLLKMAPTAEEELKLRLYSGDLSQLGPAERFLKVLVDVPFAFKRLECLLFMLSLREDVASIKEAFATLQVACKNLRNSRLFFKLLEAVLKTGNRMNVGTYRGGAQAFKLDTLLKLADVKGTDGKTSLLHFVVQEIIRSEGSRAARSNRRSRSSSSIVSNDTVSEDVVDGSVEHHRRLGLQVVSGLITELQDVKKAAAIDAEGLTRTISKLGQSLLRTKGFINAEMESLDEDSKFHQSVSKFVEGAEADISWIAGEEKRIMALVKRTVDYFHGNSGKDEGLRLFTIVRDFLIVLDKTCQQVEEEAAAAAKQAKNSKKETPTSSQQNSDLQQRLFPAIAERRVGEDSSSSDVDDDDDGKSSSSSAAD